MHTLDRNINKDDGFYAGGSHLFTWTAIMDTVWVVDAIYAISWYNKTIWCYVFILMFIDINFFSLVHVFTLCIFICHLFPLSINDQFFSLHLSCVTHWLRVERQSDIKTIYLHKRFISVAYVCKCLGIFQVIFLGFIYIWRYCACA